MKILDYLWDDLSGLDEPVKDVLVGAYWTMVTTRFSGLATTLRNEDPQHGERCGHLPEAGELVGQSARKLLGYLHLDHPLGRSIGMATLNSLLDLDESRCTARGAYDLLKETGAGKKVAVVGHFPFVPKLREDVSELFVLELRPRPGDLPASEAARILPQCQVVCLSGTTLMNGTLEGLLALCPQAFVVLTGPSSPLSPKLFDFGIHALCGARVEQPESIRPFVQQGASFKQLHPHGVKLLTLEQ